MEYIFATLPLLFAIFLFALAWYACRAAANQDKELGDD